MSILLLPELICEPSHAVQVPWGALGAAPGLSICLWKCLRNLHGWFVVEPWVFLWVPSDPIVHLWTRQGLEVLLRSRPQLLTSQYSSAQTMLFPLLCFLSVIFTENLPGEAGTPLNPTFWHKQGAGC